MTSGHPTILILGATGNFGARIARRLARWRGARLILCGRSQDGCAALAGELRNANPGQEVEAARIDQFSQGLASDLAAWRPAIVIHTAGPYQGLDDRVAASCIDIGAHYLDLADGRAFVTNIRSLDARARAAGVLVVSGASTLPGLSSAVLAHYRDTFRQIDSIEICIAPAHQTPRGLGTVQAVLGYCGKPFELLENGTRKNTHGWQNLRVFRHPDLGWRLAADCDVPDLDLFPSMVDGVRTVRFQASLEAWWEHCALFLMAGLSRAGLVGDWTRFAPTFLAISEKLIALGSRTGGMCVELSGRGANERARRIRWYLTARENHGPEIPSTPAIILAKKLAAGSIDVRGAVPCVELFTLKDFEDEVAGFEITWRDEVTDA